MLIRRFVKFSLLVALAVTSLLPATADQLYVRNRAFKGAVVREGKVTWVELKTLATALDAKLATSEGGGYQLSRTGVEPAPVAAGKVAIGTELLDTRDVNGQIMVPLEDAARLLGLKITPNRALGTVDVSFAVTQAPASGDGKAAKRSPNPAAISAGVWLTSYSEAVSQSKSSGKPILMDFTGSNWCGWCKRLKSEVFETAEFKKWAQDNVVLLELDFPRGVPQSDAIKKQNQELAQKFAINGYPTIIFANADGKVLGKYGYDKGGPAVWTKNASQMMGKR